MKIDADNNASGEVEVEIAVVLGIATLRVDQLLRLGRGAVIELDQRITDPATVLANGLVVATGDVVITSGDHVGVSIVQIIRRI